VTASAWRRHAVLLGAAAAFFSANLGFFLWYRSTTSFRAEELKRERSALAAHVAGKEREAAQLNAQRERIAGVSRAIQEFYGHRVGRSRETLAPLVNEMHDIFRAVGIFPAQISYATSSVDMLSLTEMQVSFGYVTDYPTFKRLLAAMESGSRWIVVRRFALTRDPSMPSAVHMHMVLSTYFAEEGEPGRPPARRASSSGPTRPKAVP
jgi:Tfp pilus assembly protein PilO